MNCCNLEGRRRIPKRCEGGPAFAREGPPGPRIESLCGSGSRLGDPLGSVLHIIARASPSQELDDVP